MKKSLIFAVAIFFILPRFCLNAQESESEKPAGAPQEAVKETKEAKGEEEKEKGRGEGVDRKVEEEKSALQPSEGAAKSETAPQKTSETEEKTKGEDLFQKYRQFYRHEQPKESEQEPNPEQKSEQEPKQNLKIEPKPEHKSEQESKQNPKIEPNPEHKPRQEPEQSPKIEPKPEQKPEQEPKQNLKIEPKPEHKSGQEPEQNIKIEPKKKKAEQFYFDAPAPVKEIEGSPETRNEGEKRGDRVFYKGETSTTKLPFVYVGLPETAYGNGLIMGGNASNESASYIEGVKTPFNRHILSEKSVINRNLIADDYFFTSAFGPELADSIGGVSNLTLKAPRRDKIGGFFDASMYGLSFLTEGPVAKDLGAFSASFDLGLNDFFTDLAYDNKNSVASQGDISGHLFFSQEIDEESSFSFLVIGAQDSLSYLSTLKQGVPNLSETVSPETTFFLVKADYNYGSSAFFSKLSANFLLSSYDYLSFGKQKFSTIDNRGAMEEHLSYKFNKNHSLDAGIILGGGAFTTDATHFLPPLEGESGGVRDASKLDSEEDAGYFQPSFYLKYRFSGAGFKVVPSLLFSGNLNNSAKFSGSIDPRLFFSYDFSDSFKIYLSGGLYSKRAQYDLTCGKLGSESLGYEKSAHVKLGLASERNGFFADISGYYKYFYDLIRRSLKEITAYNNGGRGWAAGTEIKIGYKNREIAAWVAYSFLKSRRKDDGFSKERAADGDIPHIFKAALAYNFLKNWNISADISVVSGMRYSEYSTTEYLVDSAVYLPVVAAGEINSLRLSNSFSYGFRLERLFFVNRRLALGLYGDVKGSNAKIDVVYNRDFTEKLPLYLAPVLGTVGLRGDF